MPEIYLILIFFVIAMMYSSVGFGGGSSYLAILSLVLSEYYLIRSTALILNLCVVGFNVFSQHRAKNMDLRTFWPFLALSVPMAYLGAQFRLSEDDFFTILGAALILSSLMMFIQVMARKRRELEMKRWQQVGLGGSVGLLSGITGIGGGIYLSPTLNLIGWKNAKVIAALASVFILFNSSSGLIGLWVAGTFQVDVTLLLGLLLAVLFGAIAGGYLRDSRFNPNVIKSLTAVLVGYVGFRLVLQMVLGVQI